MAEVLVLFDYDGQAEDELTIRKGDVIREVEKQEGGWWEGLLGSKRGFFPDNFVVVVAEAEMNGSQIAPNFAGQVGSTGKLCKALFSYSPSHGDELELKVGDEIQFLGEVEEGWWRGKLRGKEGVFPSNFVTSLSTVGTVKEPPPITAHENAPVLPPKPIKELARVLFPYTASQPDELELKEGDIVVVISKECEDKGWWKGKLNNKIGLFPDNFVSLLSTANSSSATSKSDDQPTTGGQDAIPKVRNSIAWTNESTASELSSNPRSPVDSKSVADAFISGLIAQRLATPSNSLSDEQKLLQAEKLDLSDVITPTEVLAHPTACRPRIISRRPPSSLFQKEETVGVNERTQGNPSVQSSEEPAEDVATVEQPVIKSRTPPVKPPWMEELKRNQEKRGSSLATGLSQDKPPSKPKPLATTVASPISKPAVAPPSARKESSDSIIVSKLEPKNPRSQESPSNGIPVASVGQQSAVKLPLRSDNPTPDTAKNKLSTPSTSPAAGGARGMKPPGAVVAEPNSLPGVPPVPSKPAVVATALGNHAASSVSGEAKQNITLTPNSSLAVADSAKSLHALANEANDSSNKSSVQDEVRALRHRVASLEATVESLQAGLQQLTKMIEDERKLRICKEANRNEMNLIHI